VEEWKRAQRLRPDPDVARALEKANAISRPKAAFARANHLIRAALQRQRRAGLARDVLRTLEDHFRAIDLS